MKLFIRAVATLPASDSPRSPPIAWPWWRNLSGCAVGQKTAPQPQRNPTGCATTPGRPGFPRSPPEALPQP